MTTEHKPHFVRRWYAQVYFGWKTREWPWNVPWQVVLISRKKPGPEVIAYFRKLHGLDD